MIYIEDQLIGTLLPIEVEAYTNFNEEINWYR